MNESLRIVKKIDSAHARHIGERVLDRVGLLKKKDQYPLRLRGEHIV